jgi:ArsR family transcriptional regulator, arsenate/arsenite/antimonite-responsive transcriptional repressor
VNRSDLKKHKRMNQDYSRAIPEAWQTLSRVFVALGDEHRQRILLSFERGERLNVSQIVSVSTLSRPAVSHHLKILREAQVLCSEKIGKEVFFWINKPFLETGFSQVLLYLQDEV